MLCMLPENSVTTMPKIRLNASAANQSRDHSFFSTPLSPIPFAGHHTVCPPQNTTMAKARLIYVCQSCGASASKWAGQCADCGEWNSMVESAEGGGPRGRGATSGRGDIRVQHLSDVEAEASARVGTGLVEMDRVLG